MQPSSTLPPILRGEGEVTNFRRKSVGVGQEISISEGVCVVGGGNSFRWDSGNFQIQ